MMNLAAHAHARTGEDMSWISILSQTSLSVSFRELGTVAEPSWLWGQRASCPLNAERSYVQLLFDLSASQPLRNRQKFDLDKLKNPTGKMPVLQAFPA